MVLENINFLILAIFSPALILVGILGFMTPASLRKISTEPAYNIFHIICGLAGALVLLSNHDLALKTFNLIFGLLSSYQVVASYAQRFPVRYFRWTRIDNYIHLVLAILFLSAAFLGE